jgi:hypothetical protein
LISAIFVLFNKSLSSICNLIWYWVLLELFFISGQNQVMFVQWQPQNLFEIIFNFLNKKDSIMFDALRDFKMKKIQANESFTDNTC